MIRISPRFFRQITQAAEAAYPDECCGLLAGRNRGGAIIITRAVPSDNVATRPSERFEVDPKVRFDLMREIDGGPEKIVGHYHSHPNRPASPSERDLDTAFEPELIWLIVAVKNGVVANAHAWRLDRMAKTVCEIEIDTGEEA